jgi:hypothetical protein
VAARIAPNGALHDFVYYAGSAACNSQAALDAWENQQDQQDQEAQNGDNPMPSGDTPVPQAYTQLTETTYGWCHAVGNYMEDRSQLYRLNESDQKWDWYLTFKQSWATQPNFIRCHGPANCGWLNDNRKYELSTEPRFTLAEHNPKNVSGSVTYTLGANVREGPQFTVSWEQPDVKTTDKSSLPQDTAEWGDHFAPYAGGSPKDTARYLFVSKPESIFQVPEGTNSFFLHVYDNARWYVAALGDPKTWIDSTFREHVEPPVFRVNPDLFIMTPGERRELKVDARKLAGGLLGWRLANSLPGWLVVTPSFGSGPQTLTVEVNPRAEPGDFTTLELDTDPTKAAPSVGTGPLVVKVRVVAKDSLRTKVLLAGGVDWSGRVLNTAEVWDPVTEKSAPVGNLTSAREGQTATLLQDGKILIAGGRDSSGAALKTAELFDPIEQGFTPTGNMLEARWGARATLLYNGLVLIAGGCCNRDGEAFRSAELYNPKTKKFQPAGNSMTVGRFNATATVLGSGLVLIAGGSPRNGDIPGLLSAEIFDPSLGAGHFYQTGNLQQYRRGATAVLLGNGQVLMIDGRQGGPFSNCELYTEGSGKFTYTGTMNPGRRFAASALLLDARALAVGGYDGQKTAVIYNPNTATWGPEITMAEQREAPTATLLTNTATNLDGEVLVAGGVIAGTGSSGGKLLELYNPATDRFESAGEMTTPRLNLTATAFSTTGVSDNGVTSQAEELPGDSARR